MTEIRKNSFFPPGEENLSLRPQIPMVIPREIRDLRLTDQLPKGDIAYFDTAEPDTIRLVDPITWKPVSKKGAEVRIRLERMNKRFAGIILHTPSRTPESSFDQEIKMLSALIRRTSVKEDGVTTQQNLGALFVVEDRGSDVRIGWRQQQLSRNGLVVDKRRDESIVTTDAYIISQGRRPRQHGVINLETGERSRYMVGPFIDAIEEAASAQGFTVDTRRLKGEARATKFPPGTIANLRDGGNVVYEGTDDSGKRISLVRSRKGTDTFSPSRGAFSTLAQEGKKPTVEHKPGDIVPLDIKCRDCGDGYFREEYRREAGRKRWLLIRNVVCHGAHPDGYPKYIERDKYVDFLGVLPPSLMQKDPHPKK